MSDRHTIRSINHRLEPSYRTIGLLVLGVLFMPLMPLLIPVSASTTIPNLNETEFQLLVTPAASKLPADRNTYYAMIQLQVVDNGKPVEAPQDIELTVISSDPSVISLPSGKVTLAKGESMIKVPLSSTDKAGIASITAQAVGIVSSTTAITTYRMDSLEPTRLAIYSAPTSFVPDPQFTGIVYIQVLNSQSLPAVSKNDISVDISSSDPTIGKVPSYAVIPAGSSGIKIDFTPQKRVGQTTLKASAPGLAPGELSVDVEGPIASKIKVELAPDIIPAINYHDSMMTVQLADENDNPVKASRLTKILLKSSDTSIVEVLSYVEISPGKSYATTFVESKGKLGLATITASATGYETGISTIEAVPISTATSSDPKQLQLFSLPTILPPDNSEHQSLIVAFQDMEGKPYRQTGYLYQRIALSTSNTQVGEITSSAFAAKETYAIAKFTTKYAIGDTEITASLEGYQPAQMTMEVAGAGPATVSLTQIPSIIEANNFESQSLVVSLVDHAGKPVTAQEDTPVYLSSSDPEITRIQASITIPAGRTHVAASAHTTLRAGQTTITGAADGLGAGSTVFRTVGFTGSISEYHIGLYALPQIPADGRGHEALVVQLQDQSGLPVLAKSDVPVSLSSGSLFAGTIQEVVTIPKGMNLATATFTSSFTENDLFKVTASSEGFTTVESELKTTTQPLSIYKSFEFQSRANFGEEIPVSVDIYSGALPVEGALVTVSGANAEETTSTTDATGHAEGVYIPKLPGQNTIVITASKPGYEEEQLSSRISLMQTVDVTFSAKTEGGASVPAQLKINVPAGVKVQNPRPGTPTVYDDANWGSYTVNAPGQVTSNNAVYEFSHWSDGSTENPKTWSVVEDSQISAVYKAKYLLQIVDQYGLATGGGYYDEGSTAAISMSKTTVPGAIVDKDFGGWSGSINAASPSADVVMNGPKSINVEWKDNYMKVALIAAAIGGGGFFYYWKIFKPKKELQQKERAPDLDWYKS